MTVVKSTEGPMLRVHEIDVVYGEAIHALRGLSLEVGRGSVVAVLGASGAGKMSLLRACSGLLGVHRGAVRSGRIELEGTRIERAHPASIVRRGLAQVMEGRRIFGALTVDENLRAGAFTRRDRAGVRSTYAHVLDLFPVLADRRRDQAGYLSGGEQQMLAIARTLMAAPRLLVLDEPSLGLAPMIVNQIREINGPPDERVPPEQTTIFAVDPSVPGALKALRVNYESKTVKAYTFPKG